MLAVLALVAAGSQSASSDTWRILSVDGRSVLGDAEMVFGGAGAVTGSTGCNRFTTTAAMEGSTLVLSQPLAVTKMACPDEALTAQDDAIVAFLNGGMALELDPFNATLSLSKDWATLVMAAVPAAPGAEDLLPTHAGRDKPPGKPPYLGVFGLSEDLPIRAEPSAQAEDRGSVPSGTVLRNAGCSSGWCEVELPDGSVVGWASAEHLEPAGASLRAGQGIFDATGWVPCAKGVEAPSMRRCTFGVARDGSGTATVAVTRADGLRRALCFEKGALLGADTSEADGGHEISTSREADLNFIRVNDERYEIPDAVVLGG